MCTLDAVQTSLSVKRALDYLASITYSKGRRDEGSFHPFVHPSRHGLFSPMG